MATYNVTTTIKSKTRDASVSTDVSGGLVSVKIAQQPSAPQNAAIDSVIDPLSSNAVQNRVIAAALENKQSHSETLDKISALSGTGYLRRVTLPPSPQIYTRTFATGNQTAANGDEVVLFTFSFSGLHSGIQYRATLLNIAGVSINSIYPDTGTGDVSVRLVVYRGFTQYYISSFKSVNLSNAGNFQSIVFTEDDMDDYDEVYYQTGGAIQTFTVVAEFGVESEGAVHFGVTLPNDTSLNLIDLSVEETWSLGAPEVVVDDELSLISENPVQNKVVSAAIAAAGGGGVTNVTSTQDVSHLSGVTPQVSPRAGFYADVSASVAPGTNYPSDFVAGMRGKASNSAASGKAYGGVFDGLLTDRICLRAFKIEGSTTSVYYIPNNASLVLCLNTAASNKTIYLPSSPYDGQILFFRVAGSAYIRIYPYPGQTLRNNNNASSANISLSNGRTYTCVFDEAHNTWYLSE